MALGNWVRILPSTRCAKVSTSGVNLAIKLLSSAFGVIFVIEFLHVRRVRASGSSMVSRFGENDDVLPGQGFNGLLPLQRLECHFLSDLSDGHLVDGLDGNFRIFAAKFHEN